MDKFNEVKYKNDFAKEKYDRIIVNVKKGQRNQIDEYRKAKGYASLNSYINELIRKDMNENGSGNVHISTINNEDGGTIHIG